MFNGRSPRRRADVTNVFLNTDEWVTHEQSGARNLGKQRDQGQVEVAGRRQLEVISPNLSEEFGGGT